LPVSVPPLRDFLTRFRPAGSPGAAARAGVPADRSGELEAEVAPVLARLDDTEAEHERLIAQARREAEQIVATARSAADAIAADGARRSETIREQAARQVLTAANREPQPGGEPGPRLAGTRDPATRPADHAVGPVP
jgi:hypothetical protein